MVLISCKNCHKMYERENFNDFVCTRCNHMVRKRIKHSLQVSLALTICAILLYIPAMIYPIMEVTRLGVKVESTILEGVISFLNMESYFIASVIFTASVVIPIIKLVGLLFIFVSLKINVKMSNNRKILIAENGSGKTTILNMLYYCLKYDLNKLNKFLFDECRLVFNPSNQLIIKKSELNKIDDGNIRFITQPMEVSKNDLEKSYLILQALNTIADYMFSNSGTMAFHNFLVEYLSNIYRHETKKNRYGRKSSTNLIDLLLKNNIKLDDNVIFEPAVIAVPSVEITTL